MAAGAGMASMDVGMQARAGDATTQLDLVLDPRMGLSLFDIKTEKERAESSSSSSSPAAFVLTPSMFDNPHNPFDCGPMYADALSSSDAAALVVMPETSRSTSLTPTTPPPKPLPRGANKPRDRSSHKSSSTAPSTPARDKPLVRKKAKARTGTETSEARSSTASGPDAKRTRCLERNRVAASKCREKKKQWVHELEAAKTELEDRHARLQREYTGLLGEATLIKTALMDHSVCDDRNIDMWIESEAVRFVRRANQRHRDVRRGPDDGRHSSIASLASLSSQGGMSS